MSRFLLILIVLSSFSYARLGPVYGPRYNNARAMAMGGAFLPLPREGATALFFNPASIPNLKGAHFSPLNFSNALNKDFISISGFDSIRAFSLNTYKQTLQQNPNKLAGFSGGSAPNFFFPGFAVGALAQIELAAKYFTSTDAAGVTSSQVRYRSNYQFVPAAGVGIKLAKGIVRLGYSFHWVNQLAGDVTTDYSDTSVEWNSNLQRGQGFSHNAGWALTLPVYLLPSVNIVVRNITGLRFNEGMFPPYGVNIDGTLDQEPMTVDASFSIRPKIGDGSYFNVVGQITDATNQSNVSILTRLAVGVEFAFRDTLFFRGGFGQGYPSVGMGLRGTAGEFSFSYYSEELGVTLFEEQDERFLLEYRMWAF